MTPATRIVATLVAVALAAMPGCKAVEVVPGLPSALREAFAADTEIEEYAGLCDASAVAWVDTERFVVAGDEENFLRVYRHGVSEPQTLVPLDDFLAVEPEHPEADIEAAAVVDDTAFWLSSHGRNKKGKPRPNRRRFFATTTAGDVEPAGQPYDAIVADLVGDERYAVFDLDQAARRAPKSPGGLNLEGLAPWGDGALLIGARNPVPDGLALLIPLLNPGEVVRDGAGASFGEPLRLDLDGRGVRSLERLAELGYLIAAGAPAGSSDRLYSWSGDPDDAPILVASVALNVEGMALAGDGRLLLISDDGALLVHGIPCKDAPDVADRRFRVKSVDLKALF